MDGDRAPHLRRARRPRHALRRRARGVGRGAGRPRRDLGAQPPRVDRRRPRPLRVAGAALVPVNTRFKGGEAADVLGRSRARCCSPSPTSSAPTTSRCCARPASSCPTSRRSSCVHGPARRRTWRWHDFVARADAGPAPRPRAARPRRRARRPVRHPVHLGHDRAAQGRGADAQPRPCAWPTRLAAIAGLRTGDRYLIVNPFFHILRVQGGILPRVVHGHDDPPASPSSTSPRAARRSSASGSPCCPAPPTIYQSILDHPDRERYDLRRCASRSRAPPSSRSSSSAGCATSSPSRPSSPATASPRPARRSSACRPTTTPRPSPTTVGRAVARLRGAHRRRRRHRRADAASPARSLVRGYNVMRGYLDDPEATAEAHRRRRLAPHRRRRRRRRRRQPPHHRPHQGHVHRRRLQRLPGRDREHPRCGTPTSRRWPSSASPTSAWARWAWRSSCPRRDRAVEPDGIIAWCAREMANYKVPRASRSSTRCPSTPPARS